MGITSAAGLVCLLDEGGQEVKAFALQRLDEIVDQFWAEISDSVNKIEMLHEDRSFHHPKLAALLASKVYYHLGEFQDSLFYALHAEELFDVHSSSEFVETIIAKCIDRYTEIRVGHMDRQETIASLIDEETYTRLELVVHRMFDRCFEHKQFRQALGIALETRRLDMFERTVQTADDKEDILRYAFRVALTLVESGRFRKKVLKTLVRLYMTLASPDHVNICQCLIFLDDPQTTADILEKLIMLLDDSVVMAYQIAFDLYENATQQFLHRVSSALNRSPGLSRMTTALTVGSTPSAVPGGATPSTPTVSEGTPMEVSETERGTPDTQVAGGADSTTPATAAPSSVDGGSTDKPDTPELTEDERIVKDRFHNLNLILSGEKVIELHLQFLIRNNKTDIKLLDKIKSDVRNSITHNATVIANGLMHFGTTSDQFLRDNLDWLGRAVNWAKFTATASLGVIHRGHEKEALKLMASYLPKDSGGSTSVYTEGGSLFALGLIHANHGGEQMTEYLLTQCTEATAEPVRHGACMGLGLAAMGTGRQDVYDQIKLNLYQDDAVTGEAAGIGMGLVMLGTGSPRAVEDLLSYAKDTAHEKIVRGLAMGLALVMYGRMEEADGLISSLVEDKEPILRWAGMATTAMAYCGSGSNTAIRRLLHAAVSDTSDDVRRWAVTALGFLLFKTPEQVPALVSLLSESYNPHLRYGAAMAVGIACGGTALKEALGVLEPLLEDPVHFVRQGALVANAMLLMQQNAVTCPKSIDFRERLLKICADKHDDVMAKFGAIIAMGILDAGGRNVTISLQTRTGNANMAAAVGLLVFQNFWYWYPLSHFISLAFTPTAVIALNKDLKMPKVELRSNAKPSTFAYPPPYQVEKEKKKEKVETAILSITAKQKKKEAEKTKHQEAQKMDVDPPAKAAPTSTSRAGSKDDKDKEKEKDKEADKDKEKEPEKEKEKEKEPEPNFSLLSNPARVMRSQQRVLCLPEGCRYVTLKPVTQGGILMVRDRRPGEETVLVETVKAHGPPGVGDDDEDLPEPEAPEPFQWSDDVTTEAD